MGWAANLALIDTAVRANLGPVDVTYTASGGSPIAVSGMFDANHVLVLDGIESTGPVLFLDAENVTLTAAADILDDDPAIVIDSVSYTVRERQTDGQGGVRLLLLAVP